MRSWNIKINGWSQLFSYRCLAYGKFKFSFQIYPRLWLGHSVPTTGPFTYLSKIIPTNNGFIVTKTGKYVICIYFRHKIETQYLFFFSKQQRRIKILTSETISWCLINIFNDLYFGQDQGKTVGIIELNVVAFKILDCKQSFTTSSIIQFTWSFSSFRSGYRKRRQTFFRVYTHTHKKVFKESIEIYF